jgi:hypothetical protein
MGPHLGYDADHGSDQKYDSRVPLVLLNGGGSTINVTYSRILPIFGIYGRFRRGVLKRMRGHYKVTRDQVESYRRDGHLLLRGVAAESEIAAFRPAVNKVVDTVRASHQASAKSFMQVMNVWMKNPDAMPFILAKRFAKIAATLLDAPFVRLYHDKATFKDPNDLATPWHQDEFWFPLDNESMGTMTFASGSHKNWKEEIQPIDPANEAVFEETCAARGCEMVTYKNFKAGDASFHAGRAFHKAGTNKSSITREVMSIIYMDGRARVRVPENRFQQLDMQWFLPGLKPGDLAASALNPVI